MAGLVPTVGETLPFDPPVGAHPVVVAPFGAITCVFPGKILRPIFSFLQEEFLDGGGVLDHAIIVLVAVGHLPLPRILLLGVISGRNNGGVRLLRRGGNDEVGKEERYLTGC